MSKCPMCDCVFADDAESELRRELTRAWKEAEMWKNRYDMRVSQAEIDAARADLAAARAEVERLRAGGCARDQRTTQWCAEAEALRQDLAAARALTLKLQWYAKHYPECPMWGATGDEVCNCGLSDVIDQIDAAREKRGAP